jgi:hypothetical protein
MKPISFPYQQGNLDWLCSVYATINLLHLNRDINNEDEAWKAMKSLILLIKDEGDLSAVLTKGVHKGDVQDFLRAYERESDRLDNPTLEEIQEKAQEGAIIYFKSVDGSFNHYTVIRVGKGSKKVELFDSYGFKTIQCTGGEWFIDDNAILIRQLYSLTT